jgi:1A family penicillin-binding protein
LATDQQPYETGSVPPERPGPFSLFAILTALGTVLVVAVVVTFAGYHTCGFEGCPPVAEVAGYMPDEASVVVDREDREVDKLFRVHRVVVGLDSLPEHVPQAFVATEDRSFYEHGGVDSRRVLGAAWQNIRTRGIAEGFSTITMQVARNVFPDRLPMQDRTLNRKIGEIRVARQIERNFTKDEILELYINQIYFGAGAWGLEAAAQEYFGKPATDLTLGEAALIAGLPQAPSRLNPRENMEGALERRALVLRRMVTEGYIDEDAAAAARESEPQLARSRLESPGKAAYFIEHVRRIVQDRLGDVVYTGGYRIHTTLDLDAQAVLESEMDSQLRAIETGRYGYYPHRTYASVMGDTGRVVESVRTSYLQGAGIVMDVRSGDVLALVGGRDFDDSKFNRATQARRQPGSAFKPFVYAAALQAGYPPTTILQDTPYRLVRDGQVWEPRNYDGAYAGDITMREALVRSQNIATIRLSEQVGLDRVIQSARTLGVGSDIPRFPSVAIGAAEVTLLEMVTAYATLASLGERPDPRFITHITDRHGRIVWQVAPRTQMAMASDVAFLTTDLMRDVVNRGTGAAVRGSGFRHPAAGKTGTTNESTDVWFIGSTPAITMGIWIGMDEPRRIMGSATGGRLAAPVWGRVMRRVATNGVDWAPPAGIERHQVDAYGNVVAANCPTYGDLREEYFLRGTVSGLGCPGYGAGYDTLYGDTLRQDDAIWWQRLRERVLGRDRDTLRDPNALPDTIILRPSPRDTMPLPAPRPDTIRPPTPPDTIRLPRDTVRPPPPPPDTARPDTVRPDTTPPLGDPVRPDTATATAVSSRPHDNRARPAAHA